jgi:hypothetical protein
MAKSTGSENLILHLLLRGSGPTKWPSTSAKQNILFSSQKVKKIELNDEQGIFFNDNDIGQLNPEKIYK